MIGVRLNLLSRGFCKINVVTRVIKNQRRNEKGGGRRERKIVCLCMRQRNIYTSFRVNRIYFDRNKLLCLFV